MNYAEPKQDARYNSPGQASEGFLACQNDDLSKGLPVDRPTKIGLYSQCYKCQQLTCRKRYLARWLVSISSEPVKAGIVAMAKAARPTTSGKEGE